MKNKKLFIHIFTLLLSGLLIVFQISDVKAQGLVPTTLEDVFLPGSQPLESGTFSDPDVCDNCHGGYDLAVEPAYNWRGSMMAHAARDPLMYACMTIANQDAPNVGDLCIRCHSPKGWLEGRSEPPDASALTASDRESVQCHFCHRMIKPTQVGVNPYPDDPLYTTQPGNDPSTYTYDQNYLSTLPNIPPTSGNGMFISDDQDNRRGPYFDPQAPHTVAYSPFHPSAAFCGTCHDVSNPVFDTVCDASGNIIGYTPNDFDTPASNFSPYAMFPIERTYSEWLMSEYNTPGGITGTWFGGNKAYVSTCQDCHMKDVTGKGCNKSFAPVRDDLPLHDLTGGNTFIPTLLETQYPNEVNTVALNSGINRALDMLQHAASVELTVDQTGQSCVVKVTNETGHKLPSGYPEGRRIWINVKAFNSLTSDYYESGAYDTATAELDKTGAKIYEIEPGLSPGLAGALGLTPGQSFHFVLNDTIYFDNRIPPRGFTNSAFAAIQSPPVGYSYPDGQYWDETTYNFPFIPDSIDITLFYQTTSKEFVTFLRDENTTDTTGQALYNLWEQNGKSAPVVMNHETWSGPPVQLDVTLDLKEFLEGPFNGTAMNTDLNDNNSIPLMQPYNMPPWNYNGSETVPGIPSPDIVDWVLLEIRDTPGDSATATTSTIVGQQACFIKSDGTIVGTDGSSLPVFEVTISGNLYVVVWHRNHLGVMSAYAVVRSGNNYVYDYTDAEDKVYGGNLGHKEIGTGVWGMIASDGNADGSITDLDKTVTWMSQAGLSGYYSGDYNMDNQIDNKDKNDLWVEGNGYNGQVPE